MIGYFDTSAIVPLVVAEPGTSRCAQAWAACDARISSMIAIAEAHAALAQALRLGRLTKPRHRVAAATLDRRIEELDLCTPTYDIARHAAELALAHSLRGYDAIHAATALANRSPELVAISGDRALLATWATLGLATIDIGAS